ncbi:MULTISPECIES: ABC transporter permease [unclassified Mesorhizobium]|uniref:ABC transporter permease n=1 Tax=unclassified Mesorhizobium TaxID=325217 RepID=UPI0011268A24|nr:MULTISPECIES: ABC transporter permease [unclassified Mesorhizobium]MBZ9702694.1 ABC transporter permease [Mesorhizobium sp. CO1-1-3]MBZ9948588.1 ABC transporter permease [Mesorhizobium sp. BR1-1-11]TPI47804.1 ABC transporter permease [Mesorhizobium sp. B3-1-1]TPJ09164.1 ABC transporter permease [Mesorhizobium sp. B2-8-1]TPJ62676.1 ABC transporter permease [Mesorhizobium sp. B2-6-7]
MSRFIFRRTLQMIPTLLAVVLIIFVMFSVVPGSFISSLMSEGRNATNADVMAHLNEQFGLDKPLPVRLWDYLWGLAHFDLGISYRTREPVWNVIEPRLWPSIKLALAAMGFAAAVGIPLGFLAALKPGSVLDTGTMMLAVSGLSVPEFWLGLLLMYVFALQLGLLPSFGYQPGGIRYIILPAIALGVSPMALLARTTRAGVLDVMNADFVRTARAKGLTEPRLVRSHVTRNVLVLILTTLGLQIGSLMGQAIVIEKLFSWPGIGSLLVDSVSARDIPVVQGTVIVIVLWFLVINMLVDIAYAMIDPRIKVA